MEQLTRHRITALTPAGAAALAIAGFTALGAIFDYPTILAEPTDVILEHFRAHEKAVVAWFVVLMIGAGLLAPIAVSLGRAVVGARRRWITAVGVAAATVQVVGLSRWVVLVPALSDDAATPAHAASARATFEALHFWLGTVVGETVGYALTATFTLLVVSTRSRLPVPGWIRAVGAVSAALIATGVLVPAGLEIASLTNFVGYVAWCGWLLLMSVVLLRAARPDRAFRAAGSLPADASNPARMRFSPYSNSAPKS